MTRRKKILVLCAALLVISAAALAMAWFILENRLQEQIRSFSRESSMINLNYSSMKINALAGRVRFHDASMGYAGLGRIQAQTIELKDFSLGPDYPRAMTVVFHKADLHKILESSGLPARDDLQQAQLGTGDIAVKYQFLPGQPTRLEAFLTISSPRQGHLCVQTLLSEIEPDLIFSGQNPFSAALALLGIKLEFLQAGYVDQGLVQRLSALWELEQYPSGRTREKSAQPGPSAAAENEKHKALQNLLHHQDPLLIKADPGRPVALVGLLKLESPEAASSLLNLEISNSAPDFCLSL
ncbi:MAG: hypothetical protein ACOCV7_05270 [Desulfonatronovibrionaceae bacterium]